VQSAIGDERRAPDERGDDRFDVRLETLMWDYVIGNWRTLLPTPWAEITLALMSVISGAIVGAEREKKEKPAGLRTLVLVSLGSTVFTLASYQFTTTTGDSGRVAAQIVAGIGFLGAGVILHSGGIVTGATTAATVWVTAAMGMTIGTGHAMAGLGIGVLARIVLSGIYWWESHVIEEMRSAVVELVFDPNFGKTRIRIAKLMEDCHVTNAARDLEPMSDGRVRMRIVYRLPRKQRREFLGVLAEMTEVKEMREESDESSVSAS
jgi:putative Mg2+ transporter-C (MgtC) family protein